MAYINTRSTAARTGLADRFSAFFKAFQENRRRDALYRRTVHELNMLTERELCDLGIHRSMIGRIAHEAAYGK